MRRIAVLFSVAVILITSLPVLARTGSLSHLRDKRYCEVIVIQGGIFKHTADVYSTVDLDSCPEKVWKKMNVNEIKEQFHAFMIKLNGPRYWTLDKIIGSGNSIGAPLVFIGGMKFKERADIEINILDDISRNKLYTPNKIHRSTIWIYKSNMPVYELIAPNGEVYIMQSYAQIIDPSLQMSDLKNLGQRLKLPKGWKYQTRILDKTLELKVSDIAYVIQDDLYNSYQRE